MIDTYKVKRGDSLWAIAQQVYRDPLLWPEIARANRLSPPYTILVGQELTIPWQSEAPRPRATLSTSARLVSPAAGVCPAPAAPAADPAAPSSSGGRGTARPVAMPVFKFDLGDVLAPVVFSSGNVTVTIQLKGELSVQPPEVLRSISLENMRAVAVEAKHSSDVAVGEFGSRISNATSVKYDPSSNSLELSTGVTTEFRVGGQTWLTQSVRAVPPNSVKYVYQPRPVSGTLRRHKIEGQISFEVTVTVIPQPPQTQPQPINWPRVAAVGLFAAATVLVVATIVEDVATLGAGVADDPISFAAAAAMIARGRTLWTAATRGAGIVAPAL